MCQKVKAFIERHEWLGKMPHRPTHRFIATYKGILAGVVVMATPNAFSNLLGKEHRDLEKLISRGACISWSPKNLASALIMYSVRWMAKNTHYRLFTAYSDVEARELGTIYQACNFIYLGQNSGARFEYFDPDLSENGFSDRVFRKTTSYKLYAKNLGTEWQKAWSHRDEIFWDKIPDDIAQKLKAESKRHQDSCERRPVPRKHKYLYILGKNKTETDKLKKLFNEHHPTLVKLSYPKLRGPIISRPSERPLTERPQPCWPLVETKISQKRFYSIKEVSAMYGISQWLIYHHIKTDPTFPFVNVGIKKKLLIEPKAFEEWVSSRTRKQVHQDFNLPSAKELLGVA
jgi:predicted DNA-binding transcriptional regulator AlpA